jgi:hypothetical protein
LTQSGSRLCVAAFGIMRAICVLRTHRTCYGDKLVTVEDDPKGSTQNDAHLALFQTTSAVVPMEPAGLYHFSSSSESDVMIRLLSMLSKLGHELL